MSDLKNSVTPSEGDKNSTGTDANTVTPTALPNANAGQSVNSSQNGNENANNSQDIPQATREKYAKLESDNANYRKEIEATKADKEALAAIRETYKNDPVAYASFTAAYEKRTGQKLQEHSSAYGNSSNQSFDGNQNKGSDSNDRYSEYEQFSGLTKFLEKNPNYNPAKASNPEDAEDRNLVLNSVAAKAAKIRNANPYISTDEAFDQAAKNLSGLIVGGNDAIEKAKKAGEIAGKQGAFSVGSATGGISSGDAGGGEGIDYSKFSEEQQAYFKAMAKKDPKRAERVAKLTLESTE